ncbi:MAG: TetR/AcrR family transcriptional regulator [Phenylobacterium sp.]|uniref:TetR/AcrR family transcriptional regulator n=1 Tax=Phenylobacterium sp. TaxID=1871053 RepID=UPI003918A3A8
MTESATLSRQELYERVWSRPLSHVATDLGLSPSGLSKICDRLLIPTPPRGYWLRRGAGAGGAPPALPPPPPGAAERLAIADQPAPSRRRRTRLAPEARREQLIDAAAELIARQGLEAATLKAAARAVGLSEAQAHKYFPQRRDLLTALARRELSAMEARRRDELNRGQDRQARVALSTAAYLREAAERGALIQVLTRSAEVRDALREERRQAREWDSQRVAGGLTEAYAMPPEIAYGATRVLTAVTRRAGRLIAEGKIDLAAAERLTLALVTAGNRVLARRYRA